MDQSKAESTEKFANLLDLSKEELADRVRQLQTHVTQLQNVIAKSKSQERKSHSQQRAFDFTKYNVRHVALKIAYLGWDYQGFAAQEDTNRTIEAVLFDALTKTRLIESRETSNYHRCGRTDKGVSAFSQVISIDLRTNLLEGKGVKVREGGTAKERQGEKTVEIRYVHILNKVLPQEIRVLAWCPVEPEFSARFSCKRRMYKYYFPRGNLNLDQMAEGARKLVGDNDFRNLCKMDIANGVVNFRRTILCVDLKLCQFPRSRDAIHLLRTECNTEFEDANGRTAAEMGKSVGTSVKSEASVVVAADGSSESESSAGGKAVVDGVTIRIPENSYDMCELTVVGNAFLWHQIRCIVAVLLLIGDGKESPEVITELLDVEKNPQKPQYTMASELPLILFDCDFDEVEWLHDSENREETIEQLQEMWMKHSVKATMLREMLDQMTLTSDSQDEKVICCQAMGLLPGNRARKYKPLLDRERCDTYFKTISTYFNQKEVDKSKAVKNYQLASPQKSCSITGLQIEV